MVKRLFVVGGVLAALVLGGLVALPWLLTTPALQAYVGQVAGRALGRPVRFESLSISMLPSPTVNLRRLEVAEDPAFGPGPFLTVGEGRLGIRLRPLLSGRVEMGDLTLQRPRVDLVADERGRWNWASLGASGPSAGGAPRARGSAGRRAGSALLLSRVSIAGGTVRYRTLGAPGPELRLDKVDVAIRPAGGGSLGVTGTAVAQPGEIDIALREALLTPVSGHAVSEAAIRASVDVRARDLGPLAGALAASPSATGQLHGRLDISGTLGHLVATGALGFDRVTLSGERAQCEPRRRQLALGEGRIPIVYSGAGLDSAPLEVRVARGTVSLGVAATLGAARTVTLSDIAVRGVELEPILVGFLCQSGAVTGPLDLTGSATLSADDPWRTLGGTGRLRVGPGKVTGRDVETLMSQVLGLAGMAGPPASALAFDSITASYTITDGVARTEDLVYRSADATIAGAGTVALADGRIDMRVTLTQGVNQVSGVVTGTPAALIVTPTAIEVPDARGIRRFLEKVFR